MRLFIGIKTRREDFLLGLGQELKKIGKGSFTDKNNLHLTLRFLGEVPPGKLKSICDAMAEISAQAFGLEIKGAVMFNKSGIAAAKVGGDTKSLCALHKSVETALEKIGFEKDKRQYRPHITLARKFRAFGDIEKRPQSSCVFEVKEIILFESKRVNGKLVYEPLFVKKF